MKIMGRKTVKAEKTSAPMVKTSSNGAGAKTPRRAPSYEEIAVRSYELYLARGGEPGHAEEDWLQAEAELSGAA
ncbi:MAG TPA: DUF2934 domain-containing protein [Polyangia bacterium]|jgi:hypothetical protein|nr:DUF2934 domain-containing protein [Polyangia bacterium]